MGSSTTIYSTFLALALFLRLKKAGRPYTAVVFVKIVEKFF